MIGGAGRSFWDADIDMTPAAAQHHDAAAITRPYEAPLDFTFFISCYNESADIIRTLETTCAAAQEAGVSFELIVIDDCSKDNSRELVREFMNANPGRHVVLRANRHNKGLAQNYLDGAFIGRGKYYRLICGDSAEPREGTVAILRATGQADCIVPYYPSNDGRSPVRGFISSTYTSIINAITGNRLHYYNGLAVHLRHNVMRWHTNTRGFGFQAEILCLLLDLGFTYVEVPVHVPSTAFARQDKGSGAINLRNFLSVAHTIMEIINRRIARVIYSRARK
jgi:glycosyltransferase involved in cell wall biosynthesis